MLFRKRHSGLRPKRTIRAVLWTAEEEGLLGSQAYHAVHPAAPTNTSDDTFVWVSESDSGAFKPTTAKRTQMVMAGTAPQRHKFERITLMLNLHGLTFSVGKGTAGNVPACHSGLPHT